jgi:hypothetical protein
MIYLLIVGLIALSAVLIYKARFTSDFSMGGLHFVQLYYLALSPVVCALMVTLGQEVLNRPRIEVFNVPSGIIFNLYGMFVILSAVASGIHSTTTSVFQSFLKHEVPIVTKWGKEPMTDSNFRRLTQDEKHLAELPTYHVNEKFHGGFSHNLLFVSAILATLFLGLLELNHPIQDPSGVPPVLIILFGLSLGIMQAIGIIRSTHISLSLVASLTTSGILYFYASKVLGNFPYYPVATVALINLMVLSLTLSVVGLIFIVSNRLSKTVVNRIYPKEHWFQEGMSMELLKVKIKRDWLHK